MVAILNFVKINFFDKKPINLPATKELWKLHPNQKKNKFMSLWLQKLLERNTI